MHNDLSGMLEVAGEQHARLIDNPPALCRQLNAEVSAVAFSRLGSIIAYSCMCVLRTYVLP